MPQLTINIADGQAEGEILLKGETAPIRFSARYALEEGLSTTAPTGGRVAGNGATVVLLDVKLSREWMNLLAQDLVVGKPLAVPQDTVKWLRLIGAL